MGWQYVANHLQLQIQYVANVHFLVPLWPGGERGYAEGDAEPAGASEHE